MPNRSKQQIAQEHARTVLHFLLDSAAFGTIFAGSGNSVTDLVNNGLGIDAKGLYWMGVISPLFLLGATLNILRRIDRIQGERLRKTQYYIDLGRDMVEEFALTAQLGHRIVTDIIGSYTDLNSAEKEDEEIILASETGMIALMLTYVSARAIYTQLKYKRFQANDSAPDEESLLLPHSGENSKSACKGYLEAFLLNSLKLSSITFGFTYIFAEMEIIPTEWMYLSTFAAFAIPPIKNTIENLTKKQSDKLDNTLARIEEFSQTNIFSFILIMDMVSAFSESENFNLSIILAVALISSIFALRAATLLPIKKPYKIVRESVADDEDDSISDDVPHRNRELIDPVSINTEASHSQGSLEQDDRDDSSSSIAPVAPTFSNSAPASIVFFPAKKSHSESSSSTTTIMLNEESLTENESSESTHFTDFASVSNESKSNSDVDLSEYLTLMGW